MASSDYRLFLTPPFIKDLAKLDPPTRNRIEATLAGLLANPFSGKRLKNVRAGQWRIRVGDYRIRYDIEESYVILLRVRHRKDVYRR